MPPWDSRTKVRISSCPCDEKGAGPAGVDGDGQQDGFGVHVATSVGDDRVVDLHEIDGHLAQHLRAGVARAHVVQRQSEPELTQPRGSSMT